MTWSRRDVLGRLVLGGAGAAVAASTTPLGAARASATPSSTADVVPFYGRHQAGIATPIQDRLAFAAFDVVTDDIDDLRAMLGAWAAAGARLTAGEAVGATETHPDRPPVDTGEAFGLEPARLTITVGFGPSLFAKFGLAAHRPTLLQDVPNFRNDVIDPDLSYGDLCVQACSDDPQVAFHVVRNFARIGRGDVVMRWSQLGFGRTSAISTTQSTPRNLMGFRDGTNNIKVEHPADVDEFVWVGPESDQPWMIDGTFLVIRRIRMLIETWDNTSLREQERVIGRVKESGAPIGADREFDEVDLEARDEDGDALIDVAAHIRLASPARFGGAKMLRRGYNFTDGMNPRTGRLDAGLFFIAFVRDPAMQFIPVQAELGRSDLLNEYIKHTATGIYAIPPGLAEVGDWYGRSFLT
jgi:deferrochelatase/peroxidase EfeB